MKRAVIGVDIGGTKIAAHISDGTLWSICEKTVSTPFEADPAVLETLTEHSADYQQVMLRGRNATLQTVITLCQDLITEAQAQDIQIEAIGIGSAGQVDPIEGVVMDASPHLVGWAGAKIKQAVSEALGIAVYVENDVRVMALAETTLGAGKDYEHVLCITVGTGIGGAIVLKRQLWHGAHFSAGEIGFVYAAKGETIETLYAGRAIALHYNEAHQTQYSLRDMAALAEAGDESCMEAIRNAASNLGECIAPIIGLLDPEAVLIGGGVPEIGALWWQPFTAAIAHFYLKSVQETPILQAELGNRAGMIGAAVLAAQKANL